MMETDVGTPNLLKAAIDSVLLKNREPRFDLDCLPSNAMQVGCKNSGDVRRPSQSDVESCANADTAPRRKDGESDTISYSVPNAPLATRCNGEKLEFGNKFCEAATQMDPEDVALILSGSSDEVFLDSASTLDQSSDDDVTPQCSSVDEDTAQFECEPNEGEPHLHVDDVRSSRRRRNERRVRFRKRISNVTDIDP